MGFMWSQAVHFAAVPSRTGHRNQQLLPAPTDCTSWGSPPLQSQSLIWAKLLPFKSSYILIFTLNPGIIPFLPWTDPCWGVQSVCCTCSASPASRVVPNPPGGWRGASSSAQKISFFIPHPRKGAALGLVHSCLLWSLNCLIHHSTWRSSWRHWQWLVQLEICASSWKLCGKGLTFVFITHTSFCYLE